MIVYHVGFPKTATTTLQDRLFACHSDICYLGKTHNTSTTIQERFDKELYSLMYHDDLIWDNSQVRRILDEIPNHQVAVLSQENISTLHFFTTAARRLHQLAPTAKIIFTIRNQLTLLPSFYKQVGHQNAGWIANSLYYSGNKNRNFEEWLSFIFDNHRGRMDVQFNFYKKIKLYEELFGKENIKVLLFEDLENAPEKFLSELCEFIQIDSKQAKTLMSNQRENKTFNKTDIIIQKLAKTQNPLVQWLMASQRLRAALKPGLEMARTAGPRIKADLTQDWKQKITKCYQDENHALAQEYGLNLRQYAYPSK